MFAKLKKWCDTPVTIQTHGLEVLTILAIVLTDLLITIARMF